MFGLLPKDRINCVFDESRMRSDQILKCESFDSTEITVLERNGKAEPSTNSSSRQSEEIEDSQPKARNQEDYILVIFLYLHVKPFVYSPLGHSPLEISARYIAI
jgi:hypothetical protein